MRIKKEIEAVSTIITILLILISVVFGAFVSYIWVMARFYNVPVNGTLLVVEDLAFPADNFTYFNVTVLNPSYSTSDVNITAFNLGVESTNETQIANVTDPALPFLIQKGTRQSFKCLENWSNFSGESVTIEPLTVNGSASTRSNVYTTPRAKLVISNFDASENVQYVSFAVSNPPQSMNLTISQILINGFSVNVTPSLQYPLPTSQSVSFQCAWNWEGMTGVNATIVVRTVEGYEQTYVTSEIRGAYVYVSDVEFDYTDTSYFNMTVNNSAQSLATVIITKVNMTTQNGTTITLRTIPPLDIVTVGIPSNQSLPIKCLGWDWNSYRNETITINVYTRQNFTAQSKTAVTPSTVVWAIDDVQFDLDDLEHFSVNVTNTKISLQQINITGVDFNQNATTVDPSLLNPSDQTTLVCGFNWTNYVGENATITVHAVYGSSISSTPYNLTIPFLKMRTVLFSKFPTDNPYVQITIYNSNFSKLPENLTQILADVGNGPKPLDGTLMTPPISPDGYRLVSGDQITITCPWNWVPSFGKIVTIIVQTADGTQLTKTLEVQ